MPAFKECNHYRYYSHTQSIAFENIRMLRELNMSIDEIKQYLANPGIDAFMQIADYKIKELNEVAEKIEKTKHIQQFETYDGVYTPIHKKATDHVISQLSVII